MAVHYGIAKTRSKNTSSIPIADYFIVIWEFRTIQNKTYYQVFAFWDKTEKIETWVVATYGIIKKTDKIPKKDIEKAKAIMKLYFEQKLKK